jgi:hypothetical protein
MTRSPRAGIEFPGPRTCALEDWAAATLLFLQLLLLRLLLQTLQSGRKQQQAGLPSG